MLGSMSSEDDIPACGNNSQPGEKHFSSGTTKVLCKELISSYVGPIPLGLIITALLSCTGMQQKHLDFYSGGHF